MPPWRNQGEVITAAGKGWYLRALPRESPAHALGVKVRGVPMPAGLPAPAAGGLPKPGRCEAA
eukprot:3503339-Pyramimonas_sp.AAC.1